MKAKGRLGNGVRATPRVQQRWESATALGWGWRTQGTVTPSPESSAYAGASEAGGGPGPGHRLSPPPCMDLPNKFHLILLRQRRAVSVCFLT